LTVFNLLLFILKNNGMHKVKIEENQATLIVLVDSRSPGLELDQGTPEYEGRVRLTVVPNDN